MFSALRSAPARWFATVATVLCLSAATAGPAAAAKAPAHTAISAHLTASTVLVKSTATVSGTVSPAGGSVVLERLIGAKWQSAAHQQPSRTGAFAFSVRAPKAAATWSLKVVRAASSTAKAGTGATLHLHVVTKQFVVAATSASTVTSPTASTVTGVVVPAVSGAVQVQQLKGKTWIAAATGKLGAGGAFSVKATFSVGTHKLRVLKPYTSTIAQGASASFTVTVSAPTAPPTVTTAALPAARVGVPYATELTASGGNGFYQWTGAGLPAGITLSAAGLLSGTPTTQGTASFSVTVTDGAGASATKALSLIIAAPAGRLFAAGDNTNGQLGNGTMVNALTVVPVTGMTAVTAAATGLSATLAVKTDGTVWAWGSSNAGELGNGTTTASTVPIQVPGLSGVTAVAEGIQTSYALKSDGTVWAWGLNLQGQVGDGTLTTRLSPVQVSGLTSVVQISTANRTAYALKSDGTVWAWGEGIFGDLGNGTEVNSPIPVQVSGLTAIKQVVAGNHSGYALRADGTVAAWGDDGADQLGDGMPNLRSDVPVAVSNLVQVSQIGGSHEDGYALNTSGTVFGWGYNGESELGGATANSPSGVVQITTGALQIAGGDEDGYALLPNHTVLAWGNNGDGELGIGTTTQGTTPTPMTGVSGVLSVVAAGLSDSMFLIAS
jgi:alpha-tubulin suppressor-like RCC1 family protein